MTQPPPTPSSVPYQPADTSPVARAGRLAARLRERSLRTGGVGAALHEISVLDSGTLAALPALTATLTGYQEREALPADPLRRLTAPAPARPGGWLARALPPRRAAPSAALATLTPAQWQDWQAEVRQIGATLSRQAEGLAEVQARQAQLLTGLSDDRETLTLAAQTLGNDPALPDAWRRDLAAALTVRVCDLMVALTVTAQAGEAISQLLVNQRELQGRLAVAAHLMLAAAQTGRSLQQALEQSAELILPSTVHRKPEKTKPGASLEPGEQE